MGLQCECPPMVSQRYSIGEIRDPQTAHWKFQKISCMIFQRKKVGSSSLKNRKFYGEVFGGTSKLATRKFFNKSARWSLSVSLSGCAILSFVAVRKYSRK